MSDLLFLEPCFFRGRRGIGSESRRVVARRQLRQRRHIEARTRAPCPRPWRHGLRTLSRTSMLSFNRYSSFSQPIDEKDTSKVMQSHATHFNDADDQLPAVSHFSPCRLCMSPVDPMPAVLHFSTRVPHSNDAGDQLRAVAHFSPSRTCVSPVDRMPAVLHFLTQISHSNDADYQVPPVLHFPPCRTCMSPVDGMPVSSPDFDRLPAVLHFPPDRTCVSLVDRIPAVLHFPIH